MAVNVNQKTTGQLARWRVTECGCQSLWTVVWPV